MSRVHVIAIITAKPGKRAEVLENFNANVAAVHAEDGCPDWRVMPRQLPALLSRRQ